MINSEWIFAVDEKDFTQKVVEKSKEVPVVIDFWAPWCQPCKLLMPMLEAAIQGLEGQVLLAKVNTDENPNLAGSFQVEGIPAVFALKNGLIVNRFQGLLSEKQISEFLQTLLPTEADKTLTQLLELKISDPLQAEESLRGLVKNNPKHEKARLALARILVEKGDVNSEVPALLEPLGPDGEIGKEVESIQARFKIYQLVKPLASIEEVRNQLEKNPNQAMGYYELGCHLAYSENYEEALKLMIEAGEKDMKLAKGPVREAMVSIFHLIGVGTPLANKFRSKLSSLLY